MKILITGGTGFIGSHFINYYSQYSYTILTRKVPLAAKQKNVTYIHSLNDLNNLNGFDAVINLAGEPILDKRWSDIQKSVITSSRWHVTEKLVSLFQASEKPPEVFLSGSAIGIYGNTGVHVVDENAECATEDFASIVCQKWEEIAQRVSNSRVVLMRIGIVLGDGGALKKMLLPFKLGLGGPIGNGKQIMSWIHIKDICSAINFLLQEKTVDGPVNLTSPNAVTNKEFSNKLAKTLLRPSVFCVPSIVLKTLLGESSALLLDSQNIKPKVLSDQNFSFQFADIDDAFEDLLAS